MRMSHLRCAATGLILHGPTRLLLLLTNRKGEVRQFFPPILGKDDFRRLSEIAPSPIRDVADRASLARAGCADLHALLYAIRGDGIKTGDGSLAYALLDDTAYRSIVATVASGGAPCGDVDVAALADLPWPNLLAASVDDLSLAKSWLKGCEKDPFVREALVQHTLFRKMDCALAPVVGGDKIHGRQRGHSKARTKKGAGARAAPLSGEPGAPAVEQETVDLREDFAKLPLLLAAIDVNAQRWTDAEDEREQDSENANAPDAPIKKGELPDDIRDEGKGVVSLAPVKRVAATLPLSWKRILTSDDPVEASIRELWLPVGEYLPKTVEAMEAHLKAVALLQTKETPASLLYVFSSEGEWVFLRSFPPTPISSDSGFGVKRLKSRLPRGFLALYALHNGFPGGFEEGLLQSADWYALSVEFDEDELPATLNGDDVLIVYACGRSHLGFDLKKAKPRCLHWDPREGVEVVENPLAWLDTAMAQDLSDFDQNRPKQGVVSAVDRGDSGRDNGCHNMEVVLQRLEVWLAANAPEYLAGLNPGLTDAEIDRDLRGSDIELPDDVRALYRWRNGDPHENGLLVFLRIFHPLADAIGHGQMLTDMQDSCEWQDEDGYQPPSIWSSQWLPLCRWDNGWHLCLDLGGTYGGQPGQILEVWQKDEDRSIVAGNLHAWLAAYVASLEAGYWRYDADNEQWGDNETFPYFLASRLAGYPIEKDYNAPL